MTLTRGQKIAVAKTRHGHAGTADRSRGMSKEYAVWAHMIQRCANPRNKNFPYYGGRGIVVCDAWSDFAAFYRDMGPRPSGFTLERVDNSKGYLPGNVIWSDRKSQALNRRSTIWIAVEENDYCLSDACKILGLKYDRTRMRIYAGWPLALALNPVARASI